MPSPVRDRGPMRETPSSSIADEYRLFGGGKQRDPNAVRVVPGQTFALKPWNTISRGAKGSGTVSANRKEKRFYTSHSRSDHPADAPERSSKRRRVEGPAEAQAAINISDDETPAHSSTRGSPVTTRSHAKSPTPSFSSNTRQPREYNSGLTSEYRTIDKGARVPRPSPKKKASSADPFSSEDPDIIFTRDAAKVRRKESALLQGDPDNVPWKAPAHASNLSVEIVNKPSVSDGAFKTPPPRHEKPRALSSRDSPDELQGDVTVGPVPTSLSKPRRESRDEPLSSDIRPTLFTSQVMSRLGKTRNKRGRASKGLPQRQTFRLVYYRGGSFLQEVPKGENDQLIMDPGGGDSGRQKKRSSFALVYANSRLRFRKRQESPKEAPKPPPGSTTKRMRLSDALQVTDEEAAAPRSSDTASGSRTSPSLPTTTGENTISKRAPSPTSRLHRDIGIEIPMKKFQSNSQAPTRTTRSRLMSRQTPTTLVCDDDDNENEEEYTPQPNLGGEQKWDRPLVYPRFGKKKAEVNALDLRRLAPHEFLNDNIIGFYIRFLEDHLQRCRPEAAQRVYFFNSYFFATLTKSPKGLKINYEGVAKWTRNVDIFSYDYIVVPINENAHWYMAIICNLPYLEGIGEEEKPLPSESRAEVEEVPETPEPHLEDGSSTTLQSIKEETARQSLASMSLIDTQVPQEEASKPGENEWSERDVYPDAARAKLAAPSSQPQPETQKDSEASGTPKKSRKPKKNRSYGVKYSTCQPIIITFDSLDLPRSGTISILREYLFAEAKSKRGIEIDKSLVKGMTAKEIPHQPNFSDCGLYLLAYAEKFVQDPDSFVRKLLRKEMRKQEDWPPLKSGLLRTRLRGFMELLYTEQEHLTKAKADESALVVDQQPVSYLLGDTAANNKDNVEGENYPQGKVQVERSPPAEASSKTTPERQPFAQSASPKPEIGHDVDPVNVDTQESVLCISQIPDAQLKSQKLEAYNQPSKHVVVEVPDSQDRTQANGPTAAALSTETPSSKPHPRREHSSAVYVDDSDDVEDAPQQGGVQVEETPPGLPSIK
ncbi:hypothetical protein AN8192.2 [Aspergillus nidulans FGSC A4]|uniref:Ulp1 protease family protein (AFU_orthologue AFUA_5G03200) n=1 Tax=Emericella nidulans (strain FGSC A4 / ATCC 38163 / CBS 112.46 / NRRL 194 / M139) TaxID=227321 RepID=Q5AU38_EMENI|nr:SUMO protease ULP2 [Aspergillus nidulans FGSC A4]EAA59214.1 hypothetical protein AN8192.2 [Aspergillus nidulans FGSC A4]CBF74074.1 TPA: Ulp1 protease family protein (AFU_orthologue; AFUA_5G03200) [Aspergillus nidulans FGSC A4]|eukprot:XP_681461.1 hypothetical protein AN8192.2 [Aspergillus nidulans FGSC A4]